MGRVGWGDRRLKEAPVNGGAPSLLLASNTLTQPLTFPEDFPGLAFHLRDRTTGQMVAPSLSSSERTSSELGRGPGHLRQNQGN